MRHILMVLLSWCACAAAARPSCAFHRPDGPSAILPADAPQDGDTCVEINEVVVTGLTGTARLKDTPTPVTVVSAATLLRQPSTNIIDALAHQPGIAQITTGSGISKPVIRGLGFNRVVTVSGGVRQEGQQWGDEHGIEVDGQGVHSVEILKGPASLRYGSDALAGVIIFRDRPQLSEDGVKADVSAETQTNSGLLGYSLAVQGRQRAWFWDARWSQRLAHAYRNGSDGYVVGSQFQERALSGMLGFRPAWGQSVWRLSYYHLTPGMVEGERDEETGRLEVPRPGYRKTTYGHGPAYQQVHHYKAVWDNTAALGAGSLRATVGYQQNRRQEMETEEGVTDCELDFQLHTLTYDLHYDAAFPGGWKLVGGTGGMWQRSLNRGEEQLVPDYRLLDFGLFATVSRDWGRWHLIGGARWDRRWVSASERPEATGLTFSGLTGSLGAVCNLTPHWNLRANLSRGFRAPNISELASDGEHEGTFRYEVGNARLRPEFSLQADLGLDYSSSFLSAQLSLFANRIDHYIFLRSAPELLPALPAEVAALLQEDGRQVYSFTAGNARLLGGELGVEMHPAARLHWENTFSVVVPRLRRQPRESRYLPFTPPPRWTSQLRYDLPLGEGGGRASSAGPLRLRAPYVSAGVEVNLRQHRCYLAGGTERPSPSYTLLSAAAGTELLLHGRKVATLVLAGENLADRVYQSHLSRLRYAPQNPLTGQWGVCNPGRNISLKCVLHLF